MTNVPASRAAAMWAKHAPQQRGLSGRCALARHIVEELVADGFDIAQMADQPDSGPLAMRSRSYA